jgi:hypothetical protein
MEQIAQDLSELVESFLVSKRVSGCTETTLSAYRMWFDRFAKMAGDSLTPLTGRQFFVIFRQSGSRRDRHP